MTRISLLSYNGLNPERHAYCLCLHVRPATIFVALINLAGSLICAALTFYLMINSNVRVNYFTLRFLHDDESRINGISVLMYLLLALVSAMLLYGTIKTKPRYILPFFGIQFIDYLFTLPQFLASIYSHPYRYVDKSSIEDSSSTNLLEVHNIYSDATLESNLHTTSLLLFTIILIFKTYFLCVVWKCFRYLTLQEFILPITVNSADLANQTIISPIIVSNQVNVPPPDYEEATKLPDYKPPDYSVKINNLTEANTGDHQ